MKWPRCRDGLTTVEVGSLFIQVSKTTTYMPAGCGENVIRWRFSMSFELSKTNTTGAIHSRRDGYSTAASAKRAAERLAKEIRA